MHSILILFHCESNTGYAIAKLEPVFFEMARRLCGGDLSRIHVGYSSMEKGTPATLPQDFQQYLIFDAARSGAAAEPLIQYVRNHGIDTLFAFDQPVHRPWYSAARRAGLKHFISYWGAPMSSIFGPFKRALKRLDVWRRPAGPDLYIFESIGMAQTAVLGRGISASKTDVVYLGVDTDRFRPDAADRTYAHGTFGIPTHRRIFFYSGHMEPRKGVATIIAAANHLAKGRGSDDWHVLLLGNRNGEELPLLELVQESQGNVTFGGYRNDIEQLHRSCFAGVIASTGWDSLTCSSIEMQSSGLPLILSDLLGLREAIEHNVSGLLFEPGNAPMLAARMEQLLDQPHCRDALASGARQRAQTLFSVEAQIVNLTKSAGRVISTSRR